MKANNNKKKIILIIGIMLFGLLLLSSPNIFAKENPDEQKPSTTLTKLIIQNYMNGLCSDNEGLRKSCIYFSGKYKISESVSTLKAQYEAEKNPEIKLLLFHSLNQIGEKYAVSTVKNYLKGLCSENEGLRKSCITFVGKYQISEAINTLTCQLQKENNPEIQGLISIAVNEITSGNDLHSIAEKGK
jgi:hypothetical protein